MTTPEQLDAIAREDEAFVRLEERLGQFLRAGVVVSTVLLAAGLALWLASGESALAMGTLRAGLIALMATPMLRVAVSFVEYLHLRDWYFAAMTFGVVLVLVVTVVISLNVR